MLNWVDVNRTFAELEAFRHQMDRVFAHALRNELQNGVGLSQVDRDTGTNLEVLEDAFVLTADLPGVAPEDVDLQVTADGVTLRAERNVEAPEGYSTHRRERGNWTLSRSWSLPAPVDVEASNAEVKNGVLTVRLPKTAEVQPRRIEVKEV